MNSCANTEALNNHEHNEAVAGLRADESEREQCAKAIELANEFLAGTAKINDCWGNPHPRTELMVTVWDHPTYETAFIAQALGNPKPLFELTIQCARYVAAVHLFGEARADDLGFTL